MADDEKKAEEEPIRLGGRDFPVGGAKSNSEDGTSPDSDSMPTVKSDLPSYAVRVGKMVYIDVLALEHNSGQTWKGPKPKEQSFQHEGRSLEHNRWTDHDAIVAANVEKKPDPKPGEE